MIIRPRDVRDWSVRPHALPIRPRVASPQAHGLIGWWPAQWHFSVKNLAGPGDGDRSGGTASDVLITPDRDVGLSWDFGGVNSITFTENPPDVGGGPVTVSFWIKTTTLGAQVMLGFYGAGSFDGFGVGINMTGVNGFLSYWGGLGAGAWKTSNVAFNDGLWHHAAITVEGTAISFFKDGVSAGTDTGQQPTAYTGTKRFGTDIGATADYIGSLADIRISSRALSPDTIAAMYHPATRWDLYDAIPTPPWPITSANPALQRVTQMVLLYGYNRYAEADPPPTVTACTGAGTVASGTDPTEGDSLAAATSLHAWIDFTVGGTRYLWSEVAINWGVPKRPKIERMGPVTRRFSDKSGGYVGAHQDVWVIDDDGTVAALCGSQAWAGTSVMTYVQDEAGLRSGGIPYRRFRGLIRRLRHEGGNRYRMTIEDVLSFKFSKNGQERKVPDTLISVSDGTADQALRSRAAPEAYGALSSESDAVPEGTIEAEFIGTETIIGHEELGNLHKHLITLGANNYIQAVFIGDPLSGDPPTRRAKVPASHYGTLVYAPNQTGYPLANVYVDDDGQRWAFLYVDQTHPGANPARYGRMAVTVDLCAREAVGDGSGDTLDKLALQYLHYLDKKVLQATGAVSWPGLAALDDYSIVHYTSFTGVQTKTESRISGGAKGAWVLGHGGAPITLRQFIRRANVSGDWDTGTDHHGRIMIDMLDRTSAHASAPVFTEEHDILAFRVVDDGVDDIATTVTARYKRRYRRTLQQLSTTLEGTRLPREPFDHEFEAEASETNATAQTDLGESRSYEMELEMVRDSAWAADVVGNQLDVRSPVKGRPTIAIDVPYQRGHSVELGAVIKVTHSEAPASGGWTLRRCRVVGIDDYPADYMTLIAMDVNDLLP